MNAKPTQQAPDDPQSDAAARIVRNFSLLTGGRVLGDAFLFILFVMLSRTYGQTGIGQYSFAMATSGIVGVLADFGIYTLSIKVLSRLSRGLRTESGHFLLLRHALCFTIFPIFFASIPFIPVSVDTKYILAILAAYQLFVVLGQGVLGVLLAREHANAVALLEITLKISIAAMGSIAILTGSDLAIAVSAFPIAAMMHLILAYALLSKYVGLPKIRPSLARIRGILREAVPHGLSVFIFQLNTATGLVLLGLLEGDDAVGIYNVAFRLVFLLLLIPFFAALAISPLASRLYLSDQTEFQALYQRSLQIAVLIGMPMTVGLFLLAGPIIEFVFGQGFDASHAVLQILAATLILAFLSRTTGAFLTASDRQSERTRAEFIASVVTILGSLVLIPMLGPLGAATAIVASESLLVLLYLARLKRLVGLPKMEGRLVTSVIGSTAIIAIVLLLQGAPVLFIIAAGAAAYALLLLLSPGIRDRELRVLAQLVPESLRKSK